MVTSGCQEAMIIALRGLCAGPEDVVLAAEPCYVGFTGAARVLGITVVPVPETAQGLQPGNGRAGRPRGTGQRSPAARPVRGVELRQPVRRLAERPRCGAG